MTLGDTRLEECHKEMDFLRERMAEMMDAMEEFRIAVYNLVIQQAEAVQSEAPDLWILFLRECVGEDERNQRGWKLPEEIHN